MLGCAWISAEPTLVDNTLLVVFLPLSLAVVMAGLGLHLTLADFRRVLSVPRAVGVALAVQSLLLPPLAFGLARLAGLPGELGLGLVLLAASPGGVTANIFSHIARGDVALNITLTAINSLLALVTLPLWTALALSVFVGDEARVPPPIGKVFEVAMLVIVPVALGMVLRQWRPALASAAERPVRLMSSVLLGLLIALAFISEWPTVRAFLPVVGLACVAFNLLSLLSGYVAARAARLAEPQAIAIGFEIGIHNGTLAIFIAIEVLQRSQAAIAPAVYALSMYLTGAIFAAWLLHKRKGRT
jgi:BASS family bile acid:Na+ symporter